LFWEGNKKLENKPILIYIMRETNRTPRRSRAMSDYEIMECIEQGLSKFGSSIKYAVMWRMVVLGDSPREGILANPEAFVSALQSIFGNSAKFVEQEVITQIKSKADSKYCDVEGFAELIRALRRQNLSDLVVDLPATQKLSAVN
jgi:hypothetical protein